MKGIGERFLGFWKIRLRDYLGKVFTNGKVRITLPGGSELIIDGLHETSSTAHIEIKKWQMFLNLLLTGVIGLAESYMKGHWDTKDLSSLLKYGISNRGPIKGFLRGRLPQKIWGRLRHYARRNSLKGSKKNVAYHYDLGNQFYALWLDSSMTYSSAVFASQNDKLEVAQENKYQQLSHLIRLEKSSNVLEIGCGWGGYMNHLVDNYGCQVTGITISKEQHDFVRDLIMTGNLYHSANVKIQDYREITGKYDKIVSIEMIEAVGERYWPIFFEKLKNLLKPNGDIALQLITINEEDFSLYRKNPDFIQKYIFPGGMLMTKTLLLECADTVGLRLVEMNDFGRDYARTLSIWKDQFNAAWPELKAIGFEERFRRMWNFYLSYCEAGFEHGCIEVSQVHLVHDR